MPDFTTKMHQIRFGWGAAQDPAGVAHGAPLDPLAEFWGRVGKELGRVRGLEKGGKWGRDGEWEKELDG